MKAVAHVQLAPTAAMGLGFTVSSPTAYDVAHAYSVLDCVTYLTKTYICLTAGTGKLPTAARSVYWVEVDSTYGIPKAANYALINVQGQTIRLRDDGIPASATVGELLGFNAATLPTSEIMYDRGPLWRVSIIQTGATAVVNVTFYQA